MAQRILLTAQEIENLLGKKYFYRQNIYRMADDNIIPTFNVGGTLYFSPEDVKKAAFTKLARRIRARFPHLRYKGQVISFDEQKDKKIRVHSTRSRFEVIADPEIETEENLLKKLDEKEVKNMTNFPVDPEGPEGPPPPPPHHGHGPHHPHGPHHGFPPPHEEILEVLRRIEETLARIETKLD